MGRFKTNPTANLIPAHIFSLNQPEKINLERLFINF